MYSQLESLINSTKLICHERGSKESDIVYEPKNFRI